MAKFLSNEQKLRKMINNADPSFLAWAISVLDHQCDLMIEAEEEQLKAWYPDNGLIHYSYPLAAAKQIKEFIK